MRRSDYFRFLAWCPFFVLYFGAALVRYQDDKVQVSRVRRGASPDPNQFVLVKWAYAAGSKARLCSHF